MQGSMENPAEFVQDVKGPAGWPRLLNCDRMAIGSCVIGA